MNMNHQNSTKRTIAGILAALSMIYCVSLPAAIVGAEDAKPEIIETMTATAGIFESAAEASTKPVEAAEADAEEIQRKTRRPLLRPQRSPQSHM